MNVIQALLAEIGKMFAADVWLTITALATIATCAGGLRAHVLPPAAVPFVVTGGVIVALIVGVARGARL